MKYPIALAGTLLVALSFPLLHARPNLAQHNAPPSIKTIYPTFTTIDVPGEPVTEVYGINSAGDMVGFYARSYYDPNDRGFLLKAGRFVHVDYPNSYATFAYGINDAGMIVGSAELQHGYSALGFTYDGTNFNAFREGTNSVTIAYRINDSGDIVGGAGTLNTTKGFLAKGRRFTTINFPGNDVYADATGINNLREMVGFTQPKNNAYSYIKGQFQNLDVPGAVQTRAWDINDNGEVVGSYGAAEGCSCAFAERNGKYLSFSYPGATYTFATGINAAGQIVGWYYTGYTTYHGFVTSPVTPADFE